ncbi:MAG: hypothetical protein DSY33_05920 [Archaeoglobus sp.]|jgi:thiol-disulfide isomerase/thioredoxin|nr:MAG: hypothetical protein DSY33_05920 [Archaeoglobus sp.]
MRTQVLILSVLLAVAVAGCSSTVKPSEKTSFSKHVNETGINVYFFYSPSCPHCEHVFPYVKSVAANYTNSSVRFYFCNVLHLSGKCKSIAEKYEVEWVPTVIIKYNGKAMMLVGENHIRLLGRILNALSNSTSQKQ